MPEFTDWKPCDRCRGRYLTEPLRSAIEPPGVVPEGHGVAFHLCTDCAAVLRARRSDLWGWIYPLPPVPGEGPARDNPGPPGMPRGERAGEVEHHRCVGCGSITISGRCPRCHQVAPRSRDQDKPTKHRRTRRGT